MLVVLQAMDTGGKDGVIRSLFTGINPAGVTSARSGSRRKRSSHTTTSGACITAVPPKGMIGIFNRSHYEDVLVVRVKQLVPAARWRKRYGEIVDFERMLTAEGTHIVKLFLNISKEEQRVRLQDRIDNPDEALEVPPRRSRRPGAVGRLHEAYTDALAKTSTATAPWYVVPADRKWVRNLVVAQILRDVLERIDPQFPEPEDDIAGLVVT